MRFWLEVNTSLLVLDHCLCAICPRSLEKYFLVFVSGLDRENICAICDINNEL
jgi:hypothetical protein